MTTAAPIMVRNTQPGPTVFTGGDQYIEWQGADDPSGLDVQPCPRDFLNHVQFRQAVVRGIFVVEDDNEEIEDILARHRDEWEIRQERQRNASKDALEFVADNDMLMLKCVAPVGRETSGATCDVDVPVKARQADQKPPLCHEHRGLVSQFLSEETGVGKDGKPEVKWVRMRVARRQRAQD